MPDEIEELDDFCFELEDGSEVPYVSPTNREELRIWLNLLFGLKYAYKAACPHHQSPLDAIAAAYFGEHPVVVWHAARNFGGKSRALTALACLEFMDGADVNLMGGNTKQADDDLKIIADYYKYPMILSNGTKVRHPICQLTNGPPIAGEIRGINRNLLKVITSSTRGARGPHPQRVRLDEVDEMRWNVFNSSRGQPEIRTNRVTGRMFKDNILICSTLQYANGTMSRALEEADEKGWPVFSWCYKDTMEAVGGFLTQESVDRRKAAISEEMWIQEFELDEPLVEDRIFKFEELQFLFDSDLGIIEDQPGQYHEIEGTQ